MKIFDIVTPGIRTYSYSLERSVFSSTQADNNASVKANWSKIETRACTEYTVVPFGICPLMKENLKRPFQVQHTYWPNQVGMKRHYNYTKPASPFLLEVEQDFGLGRPLEIFQYLITLGLGHRRRAPFARRLRSAATNVNCVLSCGKPDMLEISFVIAWTLSSKRIFIANFIFFLFHSFRFLFFVKWPQYIAKPRWDVRWLHAKWFCD